MKTITRDKEGDYIMIKRSTQEEDIAIIIHTHLTQEHLRT